LPWSPSVCRDVDYLSVVIAASAFDLAVFMSPALQAASASLTSVDALEISPEGFAPASDRGAWAPRCASASSPR
jgi:hypothetical protein